MGPEVTPLYPFPSWGQLARREGGLPCESGAVSKQDLKPGWETHPGLPEMLGEQVPVLAQTHPGGVTPLPADTWQAF